MVNWTNFAVMQTTIHEAKAKLSALIVKVEQGAEIVIARRDRPVAKLVPLTHKDKGCRTRIGVLAGRPYRMGKGFDDPSAAERIADDFGVPRA